MSALGKLFHHKARDEGSSSRDASVPDLAGLAAPLLEGSEPERLTAVRRLGSLGAPAVQVLADHIEHEPDWAIRNEVIDALGRTGEPTAVDALVAAADPLAEHRVDSRHVLDALRALHAPMPLLLAQLAGDSVDRRRGATVVLRELGDPAATPALTDALGDPEPTVRVQVVLALGLLGAAEALGPLVGALDDAEPLVRARAVDGIGRLAGGAATVFDPSLRATVTRYAQERRRTEAVPPLLRALTDPSPDVKAAAFEALMNVDEAGLPPETIDTAVAMLGEDEENLRRNAARFLLQTRAPARAERAVERLTAALTGVPRGGMDEPYCSSYCYEQGGAAIARAMLAGPPTGRQCCACDRVVLPGVLGETYSYVFYKPGIEYWTGDLHPDTTNILLGEEDKELFLFHQDDACVAKVRAEVSRSPMCVRCGSPLRPSATD